MQMESKLRDVAVEERRKMVDEFAQARIGAEEMLTDVRAAFYGVSLPFAVESCIHFGDEDAVDVFR